MAEANNYMLKADRDDLAARSESKRLAWEKTRKQGALYFVLFRGMLGMGGGYILLNLFFYLLARPEKRHWPIEPRVYVACALTLLLGILFGLWEWHANEKRYGPEATK